MENYYLENYNITNGQETVLRLFCDATWGLLDEKGEVYVSFYSKDKDIEVTNPFYDISGRVEVDPTVYYGEDFLNSDFMELAKSINLNKCEPYERIQEELANLLTSKLGLKSERELRNWLLENEVTI